MKRGELRAFPGPARLTRCLLCGREARLDGEGSLEVAHGEVELSAGDVGRGQIGMNAFVLEVSPGRAPELYGIPGAELHAAEAARAAQASAASSSSTLVMVIGCGA